MRFVFIIMFWGILSLNSWAQSFILEYNIKQHLWQYMYKHNLVSGSSTLYIDKPIYSDNGQMTINQDYLVIKDALTHKTINNNNDLASVGLYYYEYVFSAFPHKYVFLKHSDSCTVLTDIVESGERCRVSMPLKQLLGLAEKSPILSKFNDTLVVDYVKIICDIYSENTKLQ